MTVLPRTHRQAAAWSPPVLVLACAGVGATAATVAFALAASAPGRGAVAALTHGLMVAVPVGVALAVLRRRPGDRFALLLLGAALLLSVTTLAVSGDSVPYTIGRTAVWLVEPALVYLLLAFPSGRLTSRLDRRVFAASALVAGVLYIPTLLVVQHFPEPNPWTTCGISCPTNAFALTATEPAFVEDVVRPLREALTTLVFVAVVVLLVRHMRAAIPLGRRALAPVTATAAFRVVAIGSYFQARRDGTLSPLVEALGVVFMLSLPLIALGFAAGLVAARLYVATALERLTSRAEVDTGPHELRPEMAAAFGDPTVRTAYWASGDPGRWVDESGWPVAALEARPGRVVTEVRASGRIAAIEHDAALSMEPGIVQGAATYALAVLENHRLSAEREAQLHELSESRARIVSVGDQARRRIERDLHDGAQQRLVVLRTVLALESDRVRAESPALADVLERLGDDVEQTIDEVRQIARGIYPSLLADRGLDAALRAAALGAPLRATVVSEGIGRYEPEIETTVYFACVEALQNALKHARGASGVWITLADDGRLRFAVRDDGSGPGRGRGLGRHGPDQPPRPGRGDRWRGDDRVRARRWHAGRRRRADPAERCLGAGRGRARGAPVIARVLRTVLGRPEPATAPAEPELAAAVVDTLACGVVACDPDGAIVVLNRRAREILGADPVAADPGGPLARALRGEHVHDVRIEVVPGRGPRRLVQVSADAVVGPRGQVLGAAMLVEDVTERVADGDARELASAAIARLAHAVVVIRAGDGRIVYANEAAGAVFGHAASDLVGRDVSSLHVPVDEEPGRRTREILAALEADKVWTGDVLARRADGSDIWCTARVSGLEHAEHGSVWVVAYADAGERRAAEDARRDAETGFRALFEDGPIPIALIGPDLCVLDVNDVACALTGFTRHELVGRSLAHITHPDDVAVDADLGRRLFSGELPAFRVEKRLVTKQGTPVRVAVSTTAVPGADRRPAYGIATIEALSPAAERAGERAWA